MSNARTQTLSPSLSLSPALQWLQCQGVAAHAGLARWGRAAWLGLADVGRQRAQREMLMMADRWQQDNPTLARELRSYARGGSSY